MKLTRHVKLRTKQRHFRFVLDRFIESAIKRWEKHFEAAMIDAYGTTVLPERMPN